MFRGGAFFSGHGVHGYFIFIHQLQEAFRTKTLRHQNTGAEMSETNLATNIYYCRPELSRSLYSSSVSSGSRHFRHLKPKGQGRGLEISYQGQRGKGQIQRRLKN